jgi:hypothetical protein
MLDDLHGATSSRAAPIFREAGADGFLLVAGSAPEIVGTPPPILVLSDRRGRLCGWAPFRRRQGGSAVRSSTSIWPIGCSATAIWSVALFAPAFPDTLTRPSARVTQRIEQTRRGRDPIGSPRTRSKADAVDQNNAT